jgi:transcription initiation factor TFIIF subunit beta
MAEQVRVKSEPDVGSPGVEDELDEESTDLEFYDKTIQGDAYSRMYLARIPNYLWEQWADLGDNDEIQIGTIRQWKATDGATVSHPALHALSTCRPLLTTTPTEAPNAT